jgi:hypothetical protein
MTHKQAKLDQYGFPIRPCPNLSHINDNNKSNVVEHIRVIQLNEKNRTLK